jgi:hypothetical protein
MFLEKAFLSSHGYGWTKWKYEMPKHVHGGSSGIAHVHADTWRQASLSLPSESHDSWTNLSARFRLQLQNETCKVRVVEIPKGPRRCLSLRHKVHYSTHDTRIIVSPQTVWTDHFSLTRRLWTTRPIEYEPTSCHRFPFWKDRRT